MTKDDAHSLLNAAKAGLNVTLQEITDALWLTGDLDPLPKKSQEVIEITHAVPEFKRAMGPRVEFPSVIVHKPFSLESV